jgi:hypothetical protein
VLRSRLIAISRLLKKLAARNGFLSAQAAAFGFRVFGADGIRARRRFSASDGQQPGQSGGVVGGHGEDEAGTHRCRDPSIANATAMRVTLNQPESKRKRHDGLVRRTENWSNTER